jgi:hypothetical protein
MGLNLEWNQPRMGLKPEWDWTPNILNPKWTQPRHFPLNPFKKRAARGWVWTQEWYSTLTFLSTPRIWCTLCQGVHSIYQKKGFKNDKNVLYCNNWNGPVWGWYEFTGWVPFFGIKSILCRVPFTYSYSYITLLYSAYYICEAILGGVPSHLLSPSRGWVPFGEKSIRGWVPLGVESIWGSVPFGVQSIRTKVPFGWLNYPSYTLDQNRDNNAKFLPQTHLSPWP